MNETQRLLENLKSPRAAVREGAADALGRMIKFSDKDDVVPPLIEALRDESSKVRASAASALGNIGGEAAVPALVESLKDTAYVRANVIDALGRIGGKRAVTALTSVLKGSDQSMRLRAISALKRIGGEAAVAALIESLGDESGAVRASSAEALGSIGGEAAVAALIESLRDTDRYVREVVAEAIGRSDARDAVLPLVEALRDESSKVRVGAASALGSIGGEAAVPALIESLRDESSAVRASSAEALSRIGSKRAVPALIDALKDDAATVRVSATTALGQFVSGEMVVADGFKTEGLDWQPHSAMLERGVVEPLVAALADSLKDSDGAVRAGAIRSLTKIGGGRAVAALANALQDIGREWALEETRSFIVHEVRSALGPLHIVAKRLCESLERPEVEKEKLLEYAQRILAQTETAYQVVTQYLAYTKQLVPVLKATKINLLVREGVNEVRAQCEGSAIKIKEKFEEAAPVMVDPVMFAQALRNVLTNAIEAIERGGTLTVCTRQESGRIFVVIDDTGPGIRPEHLNRIFELGFTTKMGRQGAGLGLVVVRRIIEEGHQGRVSILNHPDGVGARVVLELPAA